MNIIKHGNSAKDVLNTEEFRCEQCGCEFSADYDEYYVEKGSCFTTSSSMSYVYSAVVTDIYICCCPRENLIALCAGCHLRADAEHHAKTRRKHEEQGV